MIVEKLPTIGDLPATWILQGKEQRLAASEDVPMISVEIHESLLWKTWICDTSQDEDDGVPMRNVVTGERLTAKLADLVPDGTEDIANYLGMRVFFRDDDGHWSASEAKELPQAAGFGDDAM